VNAILRRAGGSGIVESILHDGLNTSPRILWSGAVYLPLMLLRRYSFLLLFFLPLGPAAQAVQKRCPHYAYLGAGQGDRPRITPGDNDYKLTDPNHSDFHLEGRLRNGVLEYSVRTTSSLGDRRATWSAREEVGHMIRHFGDRVKAIEGHWQYGDNLTAFNAAVAAGVPPKQAAMQTWSGKVAADFRFYRVQIVSLKGEPGNYAQVTVRFLPEE
jgi:hypothetical protein